MSDKIDFTVRSITRDKGAFRNDDGSQEDRTVLNVQAPLLRPSRPPPGSVIHWEGSHDSAYNQSHGKDLLQWKDTEWDQLWERHMGGKCGGIGTCFRGPLLVGPTGHIQFPQQRVVTTCVKCSQPRKLVLDTQWPWGFEDCSGGNSLPTMFPNSRLPARSRCSS